MLPGWSWAVCLFLSLSCFGVSRGQIDRWLGFITSRSQSEPDGKLYGMTRTKACRRSSHANHCQLSIGSSCFGKLFLAHENPYEGRKRLGLHLAIMNKFITAPERGSSPASSK